MMYVKAFLVGGIICIIAQILIDKTKITPARILVTLVGLGVLSVAVGISDKLVQFAGAGFTTPIFGFGIALGNGVKKAIAEKGWLGALGGGLTATSIGIGAVIFLAVLIALFAKSKDKS